MWRGESVLTGGKNRSSQTSGLTIATPEARSSPPDVGKAWPLCCISCVGMLDSMHWSAEGSLGMACRRNWIKHNMLDKNSQECAVHTLSQELCWGYFSETLIVQL